jgi:hypothetical protein
MDKARFPAKGPSTRDAQAKKEIVKAGSRKRKLGDHGHEAKDETDGASLNQKHGASRDTNAATRPCQQVSHSVQTQSFHVHADNFLCCTTN